jgi:hypothetical protein
VNFFSIAIVRRDLCATDRILQILYLVIHLVQSAADYHFKIVDPAELSILKQRDPTQPHLVTETETGGALARTQFKSWHCLCHLMFELVPSSQPSSTASLIFSAETEQHSI